MKNGKLSTRTVILILLLAVCVVLGVVGIVFASSADSNNPGGSSGGTESESVLPNASEEPNGNESTSSDLPPTTSKDPNELPIVPFP